MKKLISLILPWFGLTKIQWSYPTCLHKIVLTLWCDLHLYLLCSRIWVLFIVLLLITWDLINNTSICFKFNKHFLLLCIKFSCLLCSYDVEMPGSLRSDSASFKGGDCKSFGTKNLTNIHRFKLQTWVTANPCPYLSWILIIWNWNHTGQVNIITNYNNDSISYLLGDVQEDM